ncbi:aldo/keto reductase [Populibacterium corticicola]|uniref:Aldo/keto reductase n=1 Tax=Populibacterium corticicola TaxID=1812826 RepID=A0ABW5XBC2_9MICO
METRTTSRLPFDLSVVGQGCWQLGADWGNVSEDAALEVLEAAYDAGVRFLDTADVYGDGRSERVIGQFLAQRNDPDVTVFTKMGRRAQPFDAAQFTLDNFRAWSDRSRENLGVDTLDLVQLHCPPSAVYFDGSTYDALDILVDEKRITAYGVSVETVAEGLEAIKHPGVASVQIILNAFRRKPLEEFLPAAAQAGVAVIARVPLASGLLSGRYTTDTVFAADDHRNYNRNGDAFDVGETFSGVPYQVGVETAAKFVDVVKMQGIDATPAQRALRWIIDQPGVTTVIPGARNQEQARANAAAGSQPPLDEETLASVKALYENYIREHVHTRW